MQYRNENVISYKDETLLVERRNAFNTMHPHWHDFYEIELLISGYGKHIINGSAYEWKRGAISFLRLSDSHEVKMQQPGNSHIIQLSVESIPKEAAETLLLTTVNLIAYLSDADFAFVEAQYHTLEHLFRKKEEGIDRLIHHILSALLLRLAMIFNDSSLPRPSTADERLPLIIHYISQHFRENITPEEIAKEFYMNKSYLCTYFKKHTQKTLLTYIRDLRLAYAATLVLGTKEKSLDICEACGYGSISNFLRDFKKKYGISPMEMRKRKEL